MPDKEVEAKKEINKKPKVVIEYFDAGGKKSALLTKVTSKGVVTKNHYKDKEALAALKKFVATL